jgi:hypothetical protein
MASSLVGSRLELLLDWHRLAQVQQLRGKPVRSSSSDLVTDILPPSSTQVSPVSYVLEPGSVTSQQETISVTEQKQLLVRLFASWDSTFFEQ